MRLVLLFILLIGALSVFPDIFGKDNREDLYLNHSHYNLSKAIGVSVLESLWTKSKDNTSSLYSNPIKDFMCMDEPFINQNSIPYSCTGFLIAEDLLLTAGHCMVNTGEVINDKHGYCKAFTWIFNYYSNSAQDYKNEDIYKCESILYGISTEKDDDLALIKLDRKVKGIQPLKLSDTILTTGDNVSMIGHPMGLPKKISGDSTITHIRNHQNYTKLDSFAGNSGSPVFNQNNNVVGLFLGGVPNVSTYKDEIKKCERFNYCDENGNNCIIRKLNQEDPLLPIAYSKFISIERVREILIKKATLGGFNFK